METDASETTRSTSVDFVKFYNEMVEELNVKVPNFTTHVLNLGFPQLTRRVDTAAVWGEKDETSDDGFVVVFGVNPDWVETLTPQQFATACAHETLHRVLGHVSAQGEHESPQLYNMAADLVINDYLVSVLGMEKVPNLLYGEDVVQTDCAWFTVAEVLTMLQAFATPLISPCEFLNPTNSGGTALADEMFGEESGSGEGEDNGGEDSGGEDTRIDFGDLEEFLRQTNHRIYEMIREDLPENLDSNSGVEESGGVGCSFAGSNLSFYETSSLPRGVQLKWKELLEEITPNLFGGKTNTKYMRSWHTKPRKTAWLNTSLPHVRPAPKGKLNRKQGKPKFVLALDTSGSIPHSVVRKFITLAKSIPQSKVDMDVIGFNTQVYPIDVNQARTQSGGTDFQAIQDYLVKNYPKYPELVIVLTDGLSSFGYRPPTESQRKSWRWLLTKGRKVRIAPFQDSEMLQLSDYVT